jgi:hypothetical protein
MRTQMAINKIGTIKIRSAIPGNPTDEYQYDTGATHHTTNELHRLTDIKELNLEVEGHDGKKSICKKQGTLIFKHNGRQIQLKETLYDPTYSNLISGQRVSENHCLEANIKNGTANLRIGPKIIYKMRRDIQGGLWIKPENGKQRVSKNPKPIKSIKMGLNDRDNYTSSEDEILNPNIEPEGNNPSPETILPSHSTLSPLPEKHMHHRKTAEEFTALYGNRESIHKKRPTSKARTKAVGIDKDHSTDEQARNGIYATKWAYARQRECEQLRNYGVCSIIKKDHNRKMKPDLMT